MLDKAKALWSSGLPYAADMPSLASSYSVLHASYSQCCNMLYVLWCSNLPCGHPLC